MFSIFGPYPDVLTPPGTTVSPQASTFRGAGCFPFAQTGYFQLLLDPWILKSSAEWLIWDGSSLRSETPWLSDFAPEDFRSERE